MLRECKQRSDLASAPRCYQGLRGDLMFSASAQQVQEHVLILLSKWTLQTFSLTWT